MRRRETDVAPRSRCASDDRAPPLTDVRDGRRRCIRPRVVEKCEYEALDFERKVVECGEGTVPRGGVAFAIRYDVASRDR